MEKPYPAVWCGFASALNRGLEFIRESLVQLDEGRRGGRQQPTLLRP
jgi:hypothetical protein